MQKDLRGITLTECYNYWSAFHNGDGRHGGERRMWYDRGIRSESHHNNRLPLSLTFVNSTAAAQKEFAKRKCTKSLDVR